MIKNRSFLSISLTRIDIISKDEKPSHPSIEVEASDAESMVL
jgi:hypothetical protein